MSQCEKPIDMILVKTNPDCTIYLTWATSSANKQTCYQWNEYAGRGAGQLTTSLTGAFPNTTTQTSAMSTVTSSVLGGVHHACQALLHPLESIQSLSFSAATQVCTSSALYMNYHTFLHLRDKSYELFKHCFTPRYSKPVKLCDKTDENSKNA